MVVQDLDPKVYGHGAGAIDNSIYFKARDGRGVGFVKASSAGWLDSQVDLQVSSLEAERLWLGKHKFTDKNIPKKSKRL